MTVVVIDTNVLLVANGNHHGVSAACRAACISKLQARMKSGAVAVDDAFRILGEYQNKTRPNQPKGVGDVFLKWLLQNAAVAVENKTEQTFQLDLNLELAFHYFQMFKIGKLL